MSSTHKNLMQLSIIRNTNILLLKTLKIQFCARKIRPVLKFRCSLLHGRLQCVFSRNFYFFFQCCGKFEYPWRFTTTQRSARYVKRNLCLCGKLQNPFSRNIFSFVFFAFGFVILFFFSTCAFFSLGLFQGGDKLTLALGNHSSTSSPTSTNPESPNDKLINLDSPTKVTPPVPPPRTTSDPNYKPMVENDNNNEHSIPVSVTHFSSGINGHGLERETIFSDDIAIANNSNSNKTSDAATSVRRLLGQSSTTNPFASKTNPFLDSNDQKSNHPGSGTTLDDLVEQKIQDLINANPFTAGTKYNTIGRSNPFSNPNSSKNPFLDNSRATTNNSDKIAATSSGEDVNDSPESSLEPEEVEQTINKIVSTSRIRFLTFLYLTQTLRQQHSSGSSWIYSLYFQCSHCSGPVYGVLKKGVSTTIFDTSW